MKRNVLQTILIVILTGVSLPAVYSQTQPDSFKVSSQRIVKEGSRVSVSMEFNLDEMNVRRNDMVILTPVLKSNDTNGEKLLLPPVVVTGGLRNKIVNRKENLGNQDQLPFDVQPQAILKRKNNTSQSASYNTSVLYRPWMDNASLTIEKAVSGCANCYAGAGDQLIVQNILPKPEAASYKLTFIMPEVEPVKARSDRHTATFNYIVDRYELLRDYKNNRPQFDEVDRIIGEIRDNKDLEITEFTIAGYASPEGGFEHNRKLAENRANSFAHYLVTKFGVSRDKFTVEGKGEDWAGLRKAVSDSQMADKQGILNIIDRIQNPDARDAELIKLSNGDTYRTLLNYYYPQLRRTEYTVAYVVRAFNVEEARQIIKKNPKLLSLNEMYLVAESYPSNSKEFREVFDIAVRLYPDSEIAIMNSAAADIESKNYDAAIERLKKIEDKPISWNNLGVAYILKGETEKATEYFKKSADNGNADGQANLKVIQGTVSPI
ncbi:OmpA family protein [Dysgonomonas sp.]